MTTRSKNLLPEFFFILDRFSTEFNFFKKNKFISENVCWESVRKSRRVVKIC